MSRGLRVLLGTFGLVLLAMAVLTWRGRFSAPARARAAVAAALASPPGTRVSLRELVPSAWDTVFVFTPYTEEGRIDEALGFKWRNQMTAQIAGNAGHVLMVFVRGGGVVLATPMDDARSVGCGAGLLRMAAAEATFAVDRLADGRTCLRVAAP